MKLGYIDYLNCFPFYSRLFERPVAGVEIVPGYPSELNELMRRGELDMSPISTAAYADVQSEVVILPDYCLASVGYVRSVILISKHPIENLGSKRVGLTNASQTSTALLKALLTKFYGVTPIYEPCAPKPDLDDLDAALIIGNEALLPEKTATPYVYDLGDLWLRKTGFPVVFAVFAVRKAMSSAGIKPEDVQAIGLCGQMHGVTLLDANAAPIGNAIIWADQRSAAETAALIERFGAENLAHIAGTLPAAGFMISTVGRFSRIFSTSSSTSPFCTAMVA